jgi:hypothetical protein
MLLLAHDVTPLAEPGCNCTDNFLLGLLTGAVVVLLIVFLKWPDMFFTPDREFLEEEPKTVIKHADEVIVEEPPKKRGRPKKVVVKDEE